MRANTCSCLVACSIALFACEVSHDAGSDCPDGECPDVAGQNTPCVLREANRVVGFPSKPVVPIGENARVCFPFAPDFPVAPADCQLYIGFDMPPFANNGVISDCSGIPYLEDVDDSVPGVASFKAANAVPHVCRIKHANSPMDPGWFFRPSGDLPPAPELLCLQLTPNTPIPDDVVAWATCFRAEGITRNESLVSIDPQLCSLPASSAKKASTVGDACDFTAPPVGGFQDSVAYIETNAQQCDTGACVAYHIQGDPTCDVSEPMTCSDGRVPLIESEIQQRIYCSCRCDGPAGDPGELCKCNPGFECAEVLYSGPPGVRGSYCIRSGTISAN